MAESLGVNQQATRKRLKAMGMIQKQGNWVPYELKPRDVERRFFACEQLLQRKEKKKFEASIERQTATVPRETQQSYPPT